MKFIKFGSVCISLLTCSLSFGSSDQTRTKESHIFFNINTYQSQNDPREFLRSVATQQRYKFEQIRDRRNSNGCNYETRFCY